MHLHLFVPDGAYTFEHGKPHSHRAPPPRRDELNALLDTHIGCITRTLVRAGVLIEQTEQPFFDLPFDSPLEQLSGTAMVMMLPPPSAIIIEAGRRPAVLSP